MYSTTLLVAGLFAAGSVAQTNPINVASATFLGYRNSTNTQTVRDLGFMGQIGDGGIWMLSFGDGGGTRSISTFNQSAPVGSQDGICAYITARDGGAIISFNPLQYSDINVAYNVGGCGNVPQMDYFVKLLPEEENGQGLGITNAMPVNSTHSCIWTRPTTNSSSLASAGAGLAVVTQDSSGTPYATRPFGKSTWSQNEPDWGQLSALDGMDGYTYVYANSYSNNQVSGENNQVVVARAPKADVFNKASYQYWHGYPYGWTSDPLYISDLNTSSNANLIGMSGVGQGTAWYSQYYKKFVYTANGVGFASRNVYAWTADSPEGPWAAPVVVYSDTQPDTNTGNDGFDYGGYIMPPYTSQDQKTVYFSYTRAAYWEAVVELVFV